MKTQSDHRLRTVSLDNLRQMCAHASGTAHTFEIVKVSRSRVHLAYSNPDEYGTPDPVIAIFPSIPGFFAEPDNPRVILEPLRVFGGRDEHDRDSAWQQIDSAIVSALPLYRGPDGVWANRRQRDGDQYICPDGVIRSVDWNHPYTNDTFAAFEVTTEFPEFKTRWGGNRHFAYYVWTDLTPVNSAK